MPELAEYYNKLYSQNTSIFGQGKPEKIVVDILKHSQSGSVLEIGAGEGRNAIFLAENGFEVAVQDISEVGIEKIRRIAKEKNISIKTEVGDITKMRFDRSFDVIIATFVLHHLQKIAAINLLKKIQDSTNLNGLNVVISFIKEGDLFQKNINTKKFFVEKGELRSLYGHWNILEYKELNRKLYAKKNNGESMYNKVAILLAKNQKV